MLQQWKGEVVLKHVMWEDLQQHPGWGYLGCALHVSTLLWTKPHKLQGWFNSHKAISAGQEKMAWHLLEGSQCLWPVGANRFGIQNVEVQIFSLFLGDLYLR